VTGTLEVKWWQTQGRLLSRQDRVFDLDRLGRNHLPIHNTVDITFPN
jgi:hypothetical protein